MKPIEFKDKTIVVTGAGNGMGLLAAKEFVRTGAAVVMCEINEDFVYRKPVTVLL